MPEGCYKRVAELADALQTAHDAGAIHRDINPANVLIDPDDQSKLTNFGLARVSDDSLLSITGDFAGTWSYMSPEQVTAKRMGLDHRTDVFSLRIVLYELLALRRVLGRHHAPDRREDRRVRPAARLQGALPVPPWAGGDLRKGPR